MYRRRFMPIERHELSTGDTVVIRRVGSVYNCCLISPLLLVPPVYLVEDGTLDECREALCDALASDMCDI